MSQEKAYQPSDTMTEASLSTFKTYGADLERLMILRTYPISIKMLNNETEIPAGAVRPKKDRGEHYAMCQAISLARHQGMTLTMFLEDHWCFAPIISYGLVDTPDNPDKFGSSFFIANKQMAQKRDSEVPCFPVGKYAGMVLGPLSKANYLPELVMIYCNPKQLRHLLFSLMHINGRRVTSTLDSIDSCIHSIVPSLLNEEYAVTVPDPGDYERGMADEDEMILTVPAVKMKELMDGLYHFEECNMGYRVFNRRTLHPDFQQPPFYQEYFKKWGLYESGEQ